MSRSGSLFQISKSTTLGGEKISEFKTVVRKKGRRTFVPRKAAVAMTPESRLAFKSLLAGAPEEVTGIMLRYGQSLTGEPRMVFSFGYVRVNEVGEEDEG